MVHLCAALYLVSLPRLSTSSLYLVSLPRLSASLYLIPVHHSTLSRLLELGSKCKASSLAASCKFA